MADRVFLHIGAPKTGTTYLQDRLGRNAKTLAAAGVHFPTRSPLVSPGLFHFRAALDLLGQDWGGPPGHAEGNWPAMVRRVRRASGTVIISHEILAAARPDVIARAMDDLDGAEIHIVYTARDLARQLPAGWQESIKQGRRWRFARFLRRARRGNLWFAKAVDLPRVLSTWGTHVLPERIHLITVPPRGSGLDNPLWTRFCRVTGIDPEWAPLESDRTNASLGVAETVVLRQLNQRLDRRTRREAAYDKLIREMLAQEQLVRRGSARVQLPLRAYDWVEERAGRWIDWIEASGIDVIGSAEDLRPVRPVSDAKWDNPDKVKARRQLRVALDALAAMTTEAAARPDPDQGVVARWRRQRERSSDAE